MAFFIGGRDVFVSAPVVKRNLSANDEPASFVNHAALQYARLLRRDRRSEVNYCEKEQRRYHRKLSDSCHTKEWSVSTGAIVRMGFVFSKTTPIQLYSVA